MSTSRRTISNLGSAALISAVCLAILFSGVSRAFASSDPVAFVGEFEGDGVTLSLKKGEGKLVGKLAVNGESYRVTARPTGRLLRGTFRSGNERFTFTGEQQDQDIILHSGGATFQLRRSSTKRKNPLTMSPASASGDMQNRRPERARRLQIAKRVFRGAAIVAVAALNARNGNSEGAASPGESSGPWPKQLVGKRWYEFHNSSGMSEKIVYTLCPGGRFTKSSGMSASDSLNGFSAASQGGDAGRWAASGPESQGTLRLTYQGGGSEQKTLKYDGSTLMVDGNKWLSEAAQCR